MRRGQTLFTYLHLAASRSCTEALLASGTTSIAYETVQTADGALPLLAPMSEVAGRLSAQVGAYHLMRTHGGRGVLMGGVPGVEPARSWSSAREPPATTPPGSPWEWARQSRCSTSTSTSCATLDHVFGGRVQTRYSTALELEEAASSRPTW